MYIIIFIATLFGAENIVNTASAIQMTIKSKGSLLVLFCAVS